MKKKTELRCLITGPVPDELKEQLDEVAVLDLHEEIYPLAPDSFFERLKRSAFVVCGFGDQITAEMMAECPDLRVISNVAVGYDNIDVKEATKRGIVVTNTPGVLDNATADLAFTLLLACSRRIIECDKYIREGKWTTNQDALMQGIDITGKTLGIVGMGRIGEAMARRGRGFGMKIVYIRRGDDEKDKRYKSELDAARVSLGELLKNADFVSIHCPLNQSTRHLISKAELAQMKPSAILINTARGAIVNEAELVKVLQNKGIAGAGLDVFESEPNISRELLSMDNVVLAPHIGSSTRETRLAMKSLAVESMISAISGIPPKCMVNKDVWPRFLERMAELIVPDEDSEGQPQMSMPWS